MARPERQTFKNETQSPAVVMVKASQPELPVTFTVQSHGGQQQQHITQDQKHSLIKGQALTKL